MKKFFTLLDRRSIPYTLNDNGCCVKGSLDLEGDDITALPDNLSVGGWLDLSGTQIIALPDNLSCDGLYLDVERFTNIAYQKNCGFGSRTIFAVWTGKEFKIAAGCFFDTLNKFEEAVNRKYSGDAAESYKQAGQNCVAELTKKLNKLA